VGGAREKAVVLAAALRLRDELERRGGYHVVLTRDGDAFLALDERVRIARENKAELFISLHADSNPNPAAKGASVYTLSERGGARARSADEAQNWDMDIGDTPHSPQVQRILVDLARRETTNKSADFAQALIAGLGPAAPLLRNTHRNAGFAVLLAPDVPAVLLEMGFMTNAQDEARLTDPAARARMMAGVADAIDVYFARGRAYASR
jgi:N-acetylmuramoyl-L-alanine amidase